jgi:uncharacterized membrane protein YhfC
MFGAGHGGIESILLVGIAVPFGLINMIALHGTTAEQLATSNHLDAHTAEQVIAQIHAAWAKPWWEAALALFERAVAITLHVSLSALVAFGVRKSAFWPLLLAILIHAVVDAAAVAMASAHWNTVTIELVIFAVVVPIAFLLLFTTWRASPEPTPAR